MDAYRVKPGRKLDLSRIDPADTSQFKGDKTKAKARVAKLNADLGELQELMFAEHKRRVLVVLQGMDTAGKDGVIRSVFDGVNPQGVSVAGFKVPTAEELDHDYLWRIHKHTPGKGQIVIFNRSHYEDVLVVRVRNIAPPGVWGKRYDHIRAWESILADEGTTILKFFLHISADEQRERLQARLDDPTKHWKFNVGDLKERALWDQYQAAYEDALSKTSTDAAPWYVVPANKKWYRDLVISTILVDTLKGFKMAYPKNPDDLSQIQVV